MLSISICHIHHQLLLQPPFPSSLARKRWLVAMSPSEWVPVRKPEPWFDSAPAGSAHVSSEMWYWNHNPSNKDYQQIWGSKKMHYDWGKKKSPQNTTKTAGLFYHSTEYLLFLEGLILQKQNPQGQDLKFFVQCS